MITGTETRGRFAAQYRDGAPKGNRFLAPRQRFLNAKRISKIPEAATTKLTTQSRPSQLSPPPPKLTMKTSEHRPGSSRMIPTRTRNATTQPPSPCGRPGADSGGGQEGSGGGMPGTLMAPCAPLCAQRRSTRRRAPRSRGRWPRSPIRSACTDRAIVSPRSWEARRRSRTHRAREGRCRSGSSRSARPSSGAARAAGPGGGSWGDPCPPAYHDDQHDPDRRYRKADRPDHHDQLSDRVVRSYLPDHADQEVHRARAGQQQDDADHDQGDLATRVAARCGRRDVGRAHAMASAFIAE